MYMNGARTDKWGLDNEELRHRVSGKILDIFDQLEGRDPGILFVDNILGVISEEVAPVVYNKALADVRTLLTSRMQDLDIDIDLLEQK